LDAFHFFHPHMHTPFDHDLHSELRPDGYSAFARESCPIFRTLIPVVPALSSALTETQPPGRAWNTPIR
jgi:hypothetical protein